MKTKKFLCVGLVILFALSAVFVGMGSLLSTVAFAQTAPVLTAEQYTNSDYLLYDNGTESHEKTIQSFAEGLADANVGTSANDITMVIPSQYLETVNDQTFYYCGKEYGFFLVKNGDIFDLLLIDFVFEFDREDTSNNQEPLNNEYKMEIKPILQQSFKRTGVEGDYTIHYGEGNPGTLFVNYLLKIEYKGNVCYADVECFEHSFDDLVALLTGTLS